MSDITGLCALALGGLRARLKNETVRMKGNYFMKNRRQFIAQAANAAGLVFCGCSMLDAAHAQTSPARLRYPVMIDGKRIKTIDTHAHCYFQDAIDLMGEEARTVLPPVKGVPEHFIAVEKRLAEMDARGIDLQVLSINPFWYRRDRASASAICTLNNKRLSELCAQRPDRLAAFATLPLQFPDLAVQFLDDAMKKQNLRGAAVGSSVNGEDFSDPKFHPVWAKAEELGAVIFIHPQSQPEMAKRYKGNGWLSNTIGNPLDTTIALQHLIFEGVLDKFPRLKILAAHGGGYLPSYAERGNHSCFVSPQNCDDKIVLKKKPSEYLNQLFFDAMVFSPEGLRHLVAQVGASQVVLGTDHPIPWEERPVEHVMGTTTLSDAEKVAILGGNAAKLLGVAG